MHAGNFLRPEEGIRSLESGVTEVVSCHVGPRFKTGSSARAVSVLNL